MTIFYVTGLTAKTFLFYVSEPAAAEVPLRPVVHVRNRSLDEAGRFHAHHKKKDSYRDAIFNQSKWLINLSLDSGAQKSLSKNSSRASSSENLLRNKRVARSVESLTAAPPDTTGACDVKRRTVADLERNRSETDLFDAPAKRTVRQKTAVHAGDQSCLASDLENLTSANDLALQMQMQHAYTHQYKAHLSSPKHPAPLHHKISALSAEKNAKGGTLAQKKGRGALLSNDEIVRETDIDHVMGLKDFNGKPTPHWHAPVTDTPTKPRSNASSVLETDIDSVLQDGVAHEAPLHQLPGKDRTPGTNSPLRKRESYRFALNSKNRHKTQEKFPPPQQIATALSQLSLSSSENVAPQSKRKKEAKRGKKDAKASSLLSAKSLEHFSSAQAREEEYLETASRTRDSYYAAVNIASNKFADYVNADVIPTRTSVSSTNNLTLSNVNRTSPFAQPASARAPTCMPPRSDPEGEESAYRGPASNAVGKNHGSFSAKQQMFEGMFAAMSQDASCRENVKPAQLCENPRVSIPCLTKVSKSTSLTTSATGLQPSHSTSIKPVQPWQRSVKKESSVVNESSKSAPKPSVPPKPHKMLEKTQKSFEVLSETTKDELPSLSVLEGKQAPKTVHEKVASGDISVDHLDQSTTNTRNAYHALQQRYARLSMTSSRPSSVTSAASLQHALAVPASDDDYSAYHSYVNLHANTSSNLIASITSDELSTLDAPKRASQNETPSQPRTTPPSNNNASFNKKVPAPPNTRQHTVAPLQVQPRCRDDVTQDLVSHLMTRQKSDTASAALAGLLSSVPAPPLSNSSSFRSNASDASQQHAMRHGHSLEPASAGQSESDYMDMRSKPNRRHPSEYVNVSAVAPHRAPATHESVTSRAASGNGKTRHDSSSSSHSAMNRLFPRTPTDQHSLQVHSNSPTTPPSMTLNPIQTIPQNQPTLNPRHDARGWSQLSSNHSSRSSSFVSENSHMAQQQPLVTNPSRSHASCHPDDADDVLSLDLRAQSRKLFGGNRGSADATRVTVVQQRQQHLESSQFYRNVAAAARNNDSRQSPHSAASRSLTTDKTSSEMPPNFVANHPNLADDANVSRPTTYRTLSMYACQYLVSLLFSPLSVGGSEVEHLVGRHCGFGWSSSLSE